MIGVKVINIQEFQTCHIADIVHQHVVDCGSISVLKAAAANNLGPGELPNTDPFKAVDHGESSIITKLQKLATTGFDAGISINRTPGIEVATQNHITHLLILPDGAMKFRECSNSSKRFLKNWHVADKDKCRSTSGLRGET